MLHKGHSLTGYATQESIQVETCGYFKIAQSLVFIVKPIIIYTREGKRRGWVTQPLRTMVWDPYRGV